MSIAQPSVVSTASGPLVVMTSHAMPNIPCPQGMPNMATLPNMMGPTMASMGTPLQMSGPGSQEPPAMSPDEEASDVNHQERMEYIRTLVQERERLSSVGGSDVSRRLVEQELERVQSGRKWDDKRTVEVTKEKSIKVTVKVLVPVREHPKFNFVGKLLGPKGNSLKRLQEETMSKMAILGKGSFRDKAKEEELRKNPDPKYGHLHEELHVEVTAHAPPAEAYARIAYALTEIRRYLVPDHNDEIRQEQMREMQLLNGRPAIIGPDGLPHEIPMPEGTGSLTPPNSLSPPPNATPMKMATMASATPQIPQVHNQAQIQPTMFTHPAFRGMMPNVQHTMATTMIGRFPPATLFPTAFGQMPTMAAQPQTRGMAMGFEDYASELAATMQHHTTTEYDPNLLCAASEVDKKDPLRVASPLDRARYRHDPYRRVTINVPS